MIRIETDGTVCSISTDHDATTGAGFSTETRRREILAINRQILALSKLSNLGLRKPQFQSSFAIESALLSIGLKMITTRRDTVVGWNDGNSDTFKGLDWRFEWCVIIDGNEDPVNRI